MADPYGDSAVFESECAEVKRIGIIFIRRITVKRIIFCNIASDVLYCMEEKRMPLMKGAGATG